MKFKTYFFGLIFFTCSANAQIKGIVIDQNNQPIPYVNIWIENENKGITSQENGTFTIEETDRSKNLVFSAIGFETITVKATEAVRVILKEKITALREVTISKLKATETIEIGDYESSGFRYQLGNSKNAVLYKPSTETDNFPFLKAIKFRTISDIDNATVRIRFLGCNSDGSPGEDILGEDILVAVKKGSRANFIDVSTHRFRIPEKGFFVMIEKLFIEENKYHYERTLKFPNGEKKKQKGFQYEPNLGYVPSENGEVWYANYSDKWTKTTKIKLQNPKSYENLLMRKYHDKYLVPSLKLILSN